MQETPVWSLVWKDLTCHRAAKPFCHNHWACALEPGNHSSWAHVQRLLKPVCPRARAPEEKQTAGSLHSAPAEQSLLATLETSLQQHRPRTAKNKAKRTKKNCSHPTHEILFSSLKKNKLIHTTTLINFQRLCLVSYKKQVQGLVQHGSIYTKSWSGKFIAMENWKFRRLWERRKWECLEGPCEVSLFWWKYSDLDFIGVL